MRIFKILALPVLLLTILSAEGMELDKGPKEVSVVENLETALSHFPEIYSQCEEIKKSPEFKQEQDKFKKYKLGYDQFIKYLRSICYKLTLPNPSLDPRIDYLAKLELVSRALWYQHSLMQNVIDSLCFYSCESEIQKIQDKWTHGTNNFHLQLTPNSIGAFYFYGPFFVNAPSDLNPDIKKIIDEFNANKDPEVSKLACILNLKIEQNFINEKIVALNNAFTGLTINMYEILASINVPEITYAKLVEMCKSKISENVVNEKFNKMSMTEVMERISKISDLPEESPAGFLRNNKKYLDECCAKLIQLTNQNSFFPNFIENAKNCILRYMLLHKSYEKLYRVIREEVEDFIKRCDPTKKDEKFSKFLNNPLLNKPFLQTLPQIALSKDTIRLAEIHNNLKSLKDAKLNSKSTVSSEKKAEISDIEFTKSPSIKNTLNEKSQAENEKTNILQRKKTGKTNKKKKQKSKAQSKNKSVNKGDLLEITSDIIVNNVNAKVELEPELITQVPSIKEQIIPAIQLVKGKHKKERNKTVWSDGSYIEEGEETERTIIIHDPNNKIKIELWKRLKDEPVKDTIIYKENIKEWFEKPLEALSKKIPTEKPDLSNPKHHKTIAIHSFAKFVDQFVEKHGTKCTTTGRGEHLGEEEAAIIIPGTIFYENGEQECGLFSYLIDKQGKCFHRMFDVRKNTDLIKQILNTGCLNYYEK